MQLFAGKLNYDKDGYPDKNGEPADHNFDNIFKAFYTTYAILIGDNWTDMMYNCSRSSDFITSAVYFLLCVFFGQIIMINLFLAILLGNFESA